MAFYPKQRGTTEQIFDIGAGSGKFPFTLDASGFTSAHQWVLPDSDGTASQVLSTDGAGNLTWATDKGAQTPSYIPTGETFTVETDKQVLYAEDIVIDGYLIVDGDLIDVGNRPVAAAGTTYEVQRNVGGTLFADNKLSYDTSTSGTDWFKVGNTDKVIMTIGAEHFNWTTETNPSLVINTRDTAGFGLANGVSILTSGYQSIYGHNRPDLILGGQDTGAATGNVGGGGIYFNGMNVSSPEGPGYTIQGGSGSFRGGAVNTSGANAYGGNFYFFSGNANAGGSGYGGIAQGGSVQLYAGQAFNGATNNQGTIDIGTYGGHLKLTTTGGIGGVAPLIIETLGGIELSGSVGTTGDVLTSNGTGQPTWTTISSGSGTVTSVATAGTVSGLTLTGGPITTSGTITLGGTLSLTSGDITTGLGFTPYNSTNPAGYTTNTGTVTSVGGTGTVSGLTLSGTVTTSGNLTLGGTLSLTSSDITTGLGYTPYNSTNPAGYTTNVGTVTSASVVTANGVSGSVATATSTQAITLTLGAITPSSVAASGTVTGSNLSGTNTGDQTLNSLLPSQTGNSGKYLTTDGTNSSWAAVAAGATYPAYCYGFCGGV